MAALNHAKSLKPRSSSRTSPPRSSPSPVAAKAASPKPAAGGKPAPISPLVAAKLCADVYSNQNSSPLKPGAVSSDPALAGWVRKESYPGKDGFYAAYYENAETGQKILVFRGTEPSSGKDWWANATQAVGWKSDQHAQAATLAQELSEEHQDMELAGHSLGGGLAAAASAATGFHATTFNAAGVSKGTLAREELDPDKADVDNYHVRGEVLTSVQSALPLPKALGRQHEIEPGGGISDGDVAAATAAGCILGGGAGAAAAGGGTAAAASVQRHLMTSVISSLETDPTGGGAFGGGGGGAGGSW